MIPAPLLRPRWEVAEVIRQHGAAFLGKHGGHLTGTQKKTLRDLQRCRTAALGGHVEACLDCGHARIAYNSCRNRHCPKCQALARARWLDQQAQHLLPVVERSSTDLASWRFFVPIEHFMAGAKIG